MFIGEAGGVQAVWEDVSFAARILLMAGLTVALAAAYGAGLRWLPVWAILRAGVQLSVVALLLRGVLTVPGTAAAFVLLMLTTASLTSMGRTRELWRGRPAAVLGVVAGSAISLTAVFALHLASLDARYVVATGGIVIGNAMSAATLSGRNFLRASRERVAEIEAWLALGATPTFAHRDSAREAVRESLIPTLDQSKSTGLVTLPGAFVGALFGGAGPVGAAKFQLVVLAGIALAMVTTAIVVTAVVRRSPYVLDKGA
jgi:putative ABC transport system permease protein